jgi:WD40 repeat protein
VTADKDGDIRIWDLAKNRQMHAIKAAFPSLYGLVVGSDSSRLAAFSDDGQIELWDLASAKSLRRWDLRVGVHALAFTPDGKHLVSGNENGTVYLLELP